MENRKTTRIGINTPMKQTNQRVVRKCELCGKSEFEHLKSKDFFDEAPSIVVKNYLGEDVQLTIEIGLKSYHGNSYKDKLGDVMDSYMNMGQPVIQMTPFGPMPMMEDNQLEPLIMCKSCFTGMVKLITKYGKFDKVEVF